MTDLVLEIFRVNGLLLAAGDRLTRGLGLTSARWQVLGALEDGPLTAAQIARNMGLKRQSVQRLVDLLSEQGILAFEQNPHHRRAKLVRLTEAGRDKYVEMSRIQARWANGVSQGFEAEELSLATNLLRDIEARLKESADLLIQPPGK
ncbi:MAG: MarR family transcriptional regulator [Pseudomonadota bacterium]|nr:MarR family transcriptional regulator [Pseudomonadota bacterium]